MSLPPVVTSIEDLRREVGLARKHGRTIGFVPTMGALHDGHVRLIEICARETDFAVVSIFVNPTQFGPREDFSKYPRTLDSDREKCARGGASLIFCPSVETIYPPGRDAAFVEVPGLSDVLEGASRPGHFRGVATVVLKLFNLVVPDVAFFGMKDFQQLLVIRTMVDDLNVPVTIRGVPTVREADGLAMSSRNRYLNEEERRSAVILSRALDDAERAILDGERSADRVRQILRSRIESERQAVIDYAEVADAATLGPLRELNSGRAAVALVAARVGPARLIDNRLLPDSRSSDAD